MSAHVLRAAAGRLREAAEEFRAALDDQSVGRMLEAADDLKSLGFQSHLVALSVAKMLDQIAGVWEYHREFDMARHGGTNEKALAVARAVLGGTS